MTAFLLSDITSCSRSWGVCVFPDRLLHLKRSPNAKKIGNHWYSWRCNFATAVFQNNLFPDILMPSDGCCFFCLSKYCGGAKPKTWAIQKGGRGGLFCLFLSSRVAMRNSFSEKRSKNFFLARCSCHSLALPLPFESSGPKAILKESMFKLTRLHNVFGAWSGVAALLQPPPPFAFCREASCWRLPTVDHFYASFCILERSPLQTETSLWTVCPPFISHEKQLPRNVSVIPESTVVCSGSAE